MRARRRAEEAERRASAAEQRAARAEARAAVLEAALDALPVGVVVRDGTGAVVRNERVGDPLPRTMTALVDAAVGDVLEAVAGAGDGGPGDGGAPVAPSRVLELHGPPPIALALTGRRLPVARGSAAGGPAATVVVVEDVTERRHLDAVRRDFVANMSHELRTPVGALAVLAETVAEADDPAVVRRLAARLAGEAARAGRLIEDLLDLSRIEAGAGEEHSVVRVGQVVASAVDRIRPLAQASRIAVRVSSPAAGVAVRGHEAQLTSAVVNLLENAVKYSPAGSTVELAARSRSSWVELVVRDQGIGVPAKELERIFERFYRVDPARSRDSGGTGLGLAIVRHVARSHGGDVGVVSREGEGSAFTLRLPEVDQ